MEQTNQYRVKKVSYQNRNFINGKNIIIRNNK